MHTAPHCPAPQHKAGAGGRLAGKGQAVGQVVMEAVVQAVGLAVVQAVGLVVGQAGGLGLGQVCRVPLLLGLG